MDVESKSLPTITEEQQEVIAYNKLMKESNTFVVASGARYLLPVLKLPPGIDESKHAKIITGIKALVEVEDANVALHTPLLDAPLGGKELRMSVNMGLKMEDTPE